MRSSTSVVRHVLGLQPCAWGGDDASAGDEALVNGTSRLLRLALDAPAVASWHSHAPAPTLRSALASLAPQILAVLQRPLQLSEPKTLSDQISNWREAARDPARHLPLLPLTLGPGAGFGAGPALAGMTRSRHPLHSPAAHRVGVPTSAAFVAGDPNDGQQFDTGYVALVRHLLRQAGVPSARAGSGRAPHLAAPDAALALRLRTLILQRRAYSLLETLLAELGKASPRSSGHQSQYVLLCNRLLGKNAALFHQLGSLVRQWVQHAASLLGDSDIKALLTLYQLHRYGLLGRHARSAMLSQIVTDAEARQAQSGVLQLPPAEARALRNAVAHQLELAWAAVAPQAAAGTGTASPGSMPALSDIDWDIQLRLVCLVLRGAVQGRSPHPVLEPAIWHTRYLASRLGRPNPPPRLPAGPRAPDLLAPFSRPMQWFSGPCRLDPVPGAAAAGPSFCLCWQSHRRSKGAAHRFNFQPPLWLLGGAHPAGSAELLYRLLALQRLGTQKSCFRLTVEQRSSAQDSLAKGRVRLSLVALEVSGPARTAAGYWHKTVPRDEGQAQMAALSRCTITFA